MKVRMMPQDVATQWNSTYDMLEFAVEFQEALDTITGDKEMKLRKYEMDNEEWEIAYQLRDVLKVSLSCVCPCSIQLKSCPLGLQGRNTIFLAQLYPELGNCTSCYGPH
jgi:hypothetical protein